MKQDTYQASNIAPALLKKEAKMRGQWRLFFFVLSFALGATATALPEDPTLTTIDFPGASLTTALGINPRGNIVGLYVSAGVTHGFLLSRSKRDEGKVENDE